MEKEKEYIPQVGDFLSCNWTSKDYRVKILKILNHFSAVIKVINPGNYAGSIKKGDIIKPFYLKARKNPKENQKIKDYTFTDEYQIRLVKHGKLTKEEQKLYGNKD